MKKTLIALAAVAATSVFAQSSVSITGAVGFDYAKQTNGVAGFENADAGSTNLAFTAVEDLGGGLKLKAYMQQRYNATNGASANSGINSTVTDSNTDTSTISTPRALQNVYINVAGSFGSVSYGRILMSNQGDAFAQFGTNSGDYGDIDSTGNRHDNVVAYYSPKFAGFSVNLANTVNSGNTAEYSYMQVKYAAGPFAASYAQDKNNANDVSNGTNKTIAASYDLKMAKLFITNGDSDGTKATSFGVNVPMGKATLQAMAVTGDVKATVLGVNYSLSKRTSLFADFANTTGAVSSAYRIGMLTSF